MTAKRQQQIVTLLKGIETGDEASVAVVNPGKYIQHNPQTKEGGEGLATLFKRLAKSSPRVNIVRVFSDGDYVFAHTEYDFDTSRIGFEIFRFEGDMTVEHWDNIQQRESAVPSGHTMVDGATEVTDLDKTESNRELVSSFINQVLVNKSLDKLNEYLDVKHYSEHSPRLGNDPMIMHAFMFFPEANGGVSMQYDRMHRILAEGNFVLSVSEGFINGVNSSFFDLFRIDQGKIVEHWDTIEAIPPRNEWRNDNGKF